MCTCAPEPTLPASRSGVNVARLPTLRATSRTTSFSTTLRSAAAMPSDGATGTSNWCSPYSGRKSSGSTPAARSAAIVCDGNGSARLCASSDIAGAGGLSSSSTNSCSKEARTRNPACRLQPLERGPQERPPAAIPVAAIDLSDVAEHEVQRRDPGPLVDSDAGGGIGQQPDVARRSPRVRLCELAEGRDRLVRRYPADADLETAVEVGKRHRAPANEPGQVAGDEADELLADAGIYAQAQVEA